MICLTRFYWTSSQRSIELISTNDFEIVDFVSAWSQINKWLLKHKWNNGKKNSFRQSWNELHNAFLYHFDWFTLSINETKLIHFYLYETADEWQVNEEQRTSFNRAEFIRFYQMEHTHQQFTVKHTNRARECERERCETSASIEITVAKQK